VQVGTTVLWLWNARSSPLPDRGNQSPRPEAVPAVAIPPLRRPTESRYGPIADAAKLIRRGGGAARVDVFPERVSCQAGPETAFGQASMRRRGQKGPYPGSSREWTSAIA
jgi:hypothetical protein